MGTYKRTEGQTLIETAIILFLLLLILLGITEFSRAWYTKSSLKNAVRHGARIAVVTGGITDGGPEAKPDPLPSNCKDPTDPTKDLTGNAKVFCEIWIASPGVPAGTTVNLNVDMTTASPTNLLNAGDTITVSGTTTFSSVVGSSFWPWLQAIPITTYASMRYE